MDLGILDKMKIIFDLLFSSFMFLEILLFFLLLFLLLVVNTKVKNRILPVVFSILVIISVVVFGVLFSPYVFSCIDSFLLKAMEYYYFPSTVIFFFIFLIAVLDFIYTMFSKQLKSFKKIVNYLYVVGTFFFFVVFIGLATTHNIDLGDVVTLYQNKQILSVVQVSNLLFLLWGIVSIFYYLFIFFQRKFDKKEVEN